MPAQSTEYCEVYWPDFGRLLILCEYTSLNSYWSLILLVVNDRARVKNDSACLEVV